MQLVMRSSGNRIKLNLKLSIWKDRNDSLSFVGSGAGGPSRAGRDAPMPLREPRGEGSSPATSAFRILGIGPEGEMQADPVSSVRAVRHDPRSDPRAAEVAEAAGEPEDDP